MTQIEALRFALLHITRIPTLSHGVLVKLSDVETAIKAALEAKDEPVAWQVHPFDYGIGHQGVYARTDRPEQAEAWKRKGWNVQPLYTAPPQQEAKDDLLEAVQSFLNWSDSVYYGEDTSRELENAKDKARAAIARAIEAAHGIKGEA